MVYFITSSIDSCFIIIIFIFFVFKIKSLNTEFTCSALTDGPNDDVTVRRGSEPTDALE